MTLWLFVWSWPNFYILPFRDPHFSVWSFKDGCAELFEMQADKKCPSIYSLFACFNDDVVTWPCDVIAVSQLLDMNFIHSYFQLVLHRHNIWLARHHKTMANFMSVAYVHNRWRYQYMGCQVGEKHLLFTYIMAFIFSLISHTMVTLYDF